MKKKGIRIILTVIAAVLFLSGCKKNVGTPEDNPVVEDETENGDGETEGGRLFGFSCPDLENPFYKVLKESIKTGLEEQGDEILVMSAGRDAATQNEQIHDMAASGIDALFLWPADPDADMAALEELDKAGIPIIVLGEKTADKKYISAFIGSDDRNAGRICAEDLTEKKPDGGKLAIIENPGDSLLNERMRGFEERIADAGFEVVSRIDAGSGNDAVESGLREALDTARLDAVMCGEDRMALQALSVLRETGRTDVLVYSVGGSPELKSCLAEPGSALEGIGAQSPINMGKEAVKNAAAILDGGKYEKEIFVETFFISRDNIDMYGTDGWQ